MLKEWDGPFNISNVKCKVISVKPERIDKQFFFNKSGPYVQTANLTIDTTSHHDTPQDGLHLPSFVECLPSHPLRATDPTTLLVNVLYQHVKSNPQPDSLSYQPAVSEPHSLSNTADYDLLPHIYVSARPSAPTFDNNAADTILDKVPFRDILTDFICRDHDIFDIMLMKIITIKNPRVSN